MTTDPQEPTALHQDAGPTSGTRHSAEDLARANDAHHLSATSADLAFRGSHREALAAAQDVVLIYQELADVDPEVHRPMLAIALNTLSDRHLVVGEPEDALDAAGAACAIYRQLAEKHPGVYLSDLAVALNNLGVQYAEHGQPRQAMAPAEESVRLHRRLFAVDPETYRADLATSLDNMIRRYGDLGLFPQALDAAEAATALCRQLAVADPATHRPDLARALLSAAWICAHGRLAPDRGLPAALEAADLFGELADDDPVFIGPSNAALDLIDELAESST